jgi:hypothetical protein
MFSRKFVTTLRASLVAIKQDRSAAQSPAVIAMTQALQALADEVDRTGPVLSVSDTGASVELTCGPAAVTLMGDGRVVIKGTAVTIDATGDVVIRSAKNVTIKGAQVLTN